MSGKADDAPVTITRANWYSLMQTLRQFAAGRPDIHAGIDRLGQQVLERKTVDHRALLLKYLDHVVNCEGRNFLEPVHERHFTPEEWAELQTLEEERYQ